MHVHSEICLIKFNILIIQCFVVPIGAVVSKWLPLDPADAGKLLADFLKESPSSRNESPHIYVGYFAGAAARPSGLIQSSGSSRAGLCQSQPPLQPPFLLLPCPSSASPTRGSTAARWFDLHLAATHSLPTCA